MRLFSTLKNFKVVPIDDRDQNLKLLKNAQELTITQNYLGTYRVYRYDDIYYIYVQQYGYNVMLKDSANHNYSMALLLLVLLCHFYIFIFIWDFKKKNFFLLKY